MQSLIEKLLKEVANDSDVVKRVSNLYSKLSFGLFESFFFENYEIVPGK